MAAMYAGAPQYDFCNAGDAVRASLALNPMGSIQRLPPIIRSTAAYAPPEVVDGKPPIYPYTPIKSSFEDAGSVEDMMHFVELYHGEFSEERLLRALRNIHPVDIYRIGQDDPAKLRGWKKYVFPIYTAYNSKCRKDALPMKF